MTERTPTPPPPPTAGTLEIQHNGQRLFLNVSTIPKWTHISDQGRTDSLLQDAALVNVLRKMLQGQT